VHLAFVTEDFENSPMGKFIIGPHGLGGGRGMADVWCGKSDASVLERYDKQRRGVTMEAVQKQTIQNKRDLETTDEAGQTAFRNRLKRISADEDLTREFRLRVSVFALLDRAAKLG
jgi:3-(3-hydroxy-phenyl)propionate hydroxylase